MANFNLSIIFLGPQCPNTDAGPCVRADRLLQSERRPREQDSVHLFKLAIPGQSLYLESSTQYLLYAIMLPSPLTGTRVVELAGLAPGSCTLSAEPRP